MNNRILLIYTGGTIGMGPDAMTGALEPLDFNHLVANMPEIAYLETDIDIHQFAPPIDSSNMSPALWAEIATIIHERYDDYDGFVVLHGTDTMSYTASALSFMLENLTKPVILTGSQLPIRQLRTDGKENLVTSIELAAARDDTGHPRVPEVCIYFSGKLLRGNRSTKQNADGFNAFDSFNYPHLCEAGVHFNFNDHCILNPDYTRPTLLHTAMDANVMVLSLFPGIEENLMRHVLEAKGLRSVVLRSYGSGNAPQIAWMSRLLAQAAERGITIVNISQCVSGSVAMQRYETGYQLQASGVISGRDSTVEAAVTKLMHLQARFSNPDDIRQYLNISLAGEISNLL